MNKSLKNKQRISPAIIAVTLLLTISIIVGVYFLIQQPNDTTSTEDQEIKSPAETSTNLEILTGTDIVLLTEDSHDTFVSWSPDDSKIAFTSPISGANQIYVINIDDLTFHFATEVTKGKIYVTEDAIQDYEQVTNLTDKFDVSAPKWSPNGEEILFSVMSEFGPSTQLNIINYNNKERVTLPINSYYYTYDWLDDSNILYVSPDNTQELRIFNTADQTDEVYKTFQQSIKTVNVRNHLIVTFKDEISVIDLNTGESILEIDDVAPLTLGNYYEGEVITTLQDQKLGRCTVLGCEVIDLADGYQPVLSNDGQYLAFLNDFGIRIVRNPLLEN